MNFIDTKTQSKESVSPVFTNSPERKITAGILKAVHGHAFNGLPVAQDRRWLLILFVVFAIIFNEPLSAQNVPSRKTAGSVGKISIHTPGGLRDTLWAEYGHPSLYFTESDINPPTIVTCAPNQIITATSNCQAAVPNFTSGVVATDDVTPQGSLIIAQSPASGTMVGLGITNIILTVTDQAGNSATCTATLTVNGNITATAGSNSPVNTGCNLNLNSSGGVAYAWTGPNSFNSSQQNPTITNVTTAAAGTYTVTVTGSNGCTASASTFVVVNTLSSTFTVFTETMGNATTSSSITAYETANGFDNDGYTMSGVGTVSNAAPASNYSGASGAGNVSLAATTPVRYLQIAGIYTSGLSNLTLSFGLYKNLSSTGSELLIQVSSDGSNWTTLTIPTLSTTTAWYYVTCTGSIPATSNLRIRLTNTATSGPTFRLDDIKLSGSTTNAIIIPQGPTTFCQNDTVPLITNPGNSYLWNTGATTQSIKVTTPGTYTVTFTSSGGCATSASLTINPWPATSSNGPVCAGSTLNLNAGNSVSYSWSGPDYFLSTNQNPVISNIEPALAGNYTVTVTDDNGCSASMSTAVAVNTFSSVVNVFTETMGDAGAGNYTIAQYQNAHSFDNTGYNITGTGTVNNTSPSTGYPVATGLANVVIISGSSKYFEIAGINTNGLNNLSLSFGLYKNLTSTGSELLVQVSSDGTNWTTLAMPTLATTVAWYYVTCSGNIPATSSLYIMWTNMALTGGPQFRIDDIKLSGIPLPAIGSNSPVCMGSTLNLTSGGGVSYSWTGPNGFTTTAQNPSLTNVTNAAAGNYTVTVTNGVGCSSTAPTAVIINTNPVATAGSDSPKCEGTTLNLNSSGGTSYSWSGPNSFSSALQNPTISNVTTAAAGTYTVTVTNGAGCSSTAPTTVTINTNPIATAGSDSPKCAGTTLNLNSSGGITYSWSGPNSFSSALQNPAISNVTTAAAGTYTVTVTNGAGCSSTATTNVTINTNPVATAGSNSPLCAANTLNLSSGGGVSYAWTGPNSFSSTDQDPSIANVTTAASGTYIVTVTGSNGCTASTSTAVVVNSFASFFDVFVETMGDSPTGITINNYEIANGFDNDNYTMSGVGTVNDVNPSGVYPGASGLANVVIIGDGTHYFKIAGINTSGLGNLSLSFGVYKNLSSTGAELLTEVSSDGNNWTALSMPVLPTPSAWYYVTCTGNIPAVSNLYIRWTNTAAVGGPQFRIDDIKLHGAYINAAITASGPTTFCQGGSVSLTATSGSSYLWSTNETTQAITVNTSGTYAVTVTDANGCTSSASQVVVVNPIPDATITPESATTFCQGGSVTIDAVAGNTYLWSNAATTQTINVTTSGTYIVTVTNSYGCSAVSTGITVTVNPLPVPTAGNNSPLCAANTLNLSSGGGVSYAWTGPNGFSSTDQNPSIANVTTAASGTYTVTVTGSDGCTASASTTVVVNSFASFFDVFVETMGDAPNSITINNYESANGFDNDNYSMSGIGTVLNTVPSSGYPGASGLANVAIVSDGAHYFEIAGINTSGLGNLSLSFGVYKNLSSTGAELLTEVSSDGNNWTALSMPVLPTPTAWYYVTCTGNIAATSNLYIRWTNTAAVGGPQFRIDDIKLHGAYINAAITASGPTTFCQGGSVSLTATPGSSYLWSTNETTQAITVNTSGTYAVTVTDANGCTSSASQVVVVNPLPDATITPESATTFCQGGSVTIDAVAGNTYLWSNAATTQTINVTTSGTYIVTVTNSYGCSAVSTGTIVMVNPLPVPTAGSNSPVCTGSNLNLTSGGGVSYAWTGPNGFSSTEQNPSIAPVTTTLATGTYTVTVTGSNGCTASVSTAVVINAFASFFDVFVETMGDAPSTITINNHELANGFDNDGYTMSGVGSLSNVNFSNGYAGASGQASVVIVGDGTHYFKIAGINTSGLGNLSLSFGVYKNLSSTGTELLTEVSSDGNNWTALSMPVLPTPTAWYYVTCTGNIPATSNLYIRWTNTAALGGPQFRIDDIKLHGAYINATITASGPTTFCQGGSVSLTATPGNSYLWSTNETTQAITVNTSGTYTVTVTDANGCTSSASQVVVVNPLPDATITPESATTFCQGGSVTIDAVAGSTYLWSNAATTQTINVTTSATYIVTVTNSYSCSAVSTGITVTVNPLPIPTAGNNSPLCAANTLNLSSGGGVSYAWTGPNGFSSTDQNPSIANVTTAASGTYTVTVTGSDGCTASASTAVVVNSFASFFDVFVETMGDSPTGITINNYEIANGFDNDNYTMSGVGTVNDVNPSGVYPGASGLANVVIIGDGTHYFKIAGINTSGLGNLSLSFGVYKNLSSTGTELLTEVSSDGNNWTALSMPVLPTPTAWYYVTCTGNIPATSNLYIRWTNTAALGGPQFRIDDIKLHGAYINAAITASGPTTFCQGGSVSLTATSGSSYLWSTNETTQAITVNTSGTYTVTVTDANGCTSSASQVVVVNPIPDATITPESATTFCQGGSVTIDAVAGNTYLWSNAATTQTINVTTSGTYIVTVTNSYSCSAVSTGITVTVNPLPIPTAGNNSPLCAANTLNLSSGGGVSYAWTGPNGFSSTDQNPSIANVTTAASGTYTVTVTGSDGCTASASTAVVVNSFASFFDVFVETMGDAPSTITINNHELANGFDNDGYTMSGVGSLSNVNFSNGYAGASGQASVVIVGDGTHYFKIAGINTSGLGNLSLSFGVYKNLSSTGAELLTEVSSDGSNWTALSMPVLPTPTAWYYVTCTGNIPAVSNLYIRWTNTAAVGGPQFRIDDIKLHGAYINAAITASGPTTFCQGGSVSLTATPGSSYLWSTNETTRAITVNTSGTYTVTVTDANGCTSSASQGVVVNPLPIATITASGPTTFCQGNSVTLTSSPGASYLWSTGSTNQAIIEATTGTYTVTVTDVLGCSAASLPVTVTVNVLPNPIVGSNSPVCTGSTLNLNSNSEVSYAWTGPNGFISTDQNPMIGNVALAAAGNYTVTVTDTNGCSASAGTAVLVNTFSPLTDVFVETMGDAPIAVTINNHELANGFDNVGYTMSGIGTVNNAVPSVGYPGSSGLANVVLLSGGTRYFQIAGINTSGFNDLTLSFGVQKTSGSTGSELLIEVSSDGITYTPIIMPALTTGTTWRYVTCTGSIPATADLRIRWTNTALNGTFFRIDDVKLSGSLNPIAGSNSPVCAGSTLNFTTGIGTTYAWSGPNGFTSPDQNPSIANVSTMASGAYTVTVTSTNGCTASASTSVVVNAFASFFDVFTETMGTAPTAVTINAHEAAHGFDNTGYSISGVGTVNNVVPSNGYQGASGLANVVLLSGGTHYFQIAGINTSGLDNLSLSFGIYKNLSSTGTELLIEVSPDGINWTPLSMPSLPTPTEWYYVTCTGNIPASYNLYIRWTNIGASGGPQFRIDDVKLNGSSPVAFITAAGSTTFCQGDTVQLTSSPGSSYLWSTNAITQAITASTSGTYAVTVTDANGCTSSAGMVVVVNNFESFFDIFTETIGDSSAVYNIPVYEAANGFDNDQFFMSGTGDVRGTTPSSGYTGASGGDNVLLNNNTGSRSFEIADINSMGYNDLTLSFGIFKGSAYDGSDLTVEVSSDGVNYNALSMPSLPTGTGTGKWYYRTCTGSIPATQNLHIRWTNNATGGTGPQYRLDDINLSAGSPVALISASGPVTFCQGDSVMLTASKGSSYFWSTGETARTIIVNSSGTNSVVITDVNGCTASASTVVTVNTAPAISCPADLTQNNSTGQCGTDVTWADAIFSGSPVPTVTYSKTSGSFFPVGSTIVYVTAINVCGTASCSFTVTVHDTSAPTITCPPDITTTVSTGCTVTGLSLGVPVTSDNCSVVSVTNNAPTVFPTGITTVTWTVADSTGNSAQCEQLVTVNDVTPPVIHCPTNKLRYTAAGVCTYTIPAGNAVFDATATDNCGVTLMTYILSGATADTGTSTLALHAFDKGVTTVNWIATDAYGNSSSCSFLVTVNDNRPPVIHCGADRNVFAGIDSCTYTKSNSTVWDATATDNCGVTSLDFVLSGATTGAGTTLANQVFEKGVTAVLWTAADASGNVDTCSFLVTVIDNRRPVIHCTTDKNVFTTTNSCTYIKSNNTTWDATATDNCGVASITYIMSGATIDTGTTLALHVFELGVTTVLWTATDGSGNADTCSFLLTVSDDHPPVIHCGADKNVFTAVNSCTYTKSNNTIWDATATDNCGVTSIDFILSGATTGTGTTLANQIFEKGVTAVLWTAADASGNTDTCSFLVTVIDHVSPTILCPADVIATTNNGCNVTGVVLGMPATNDNCSVASVTNDAPVVFPIGYTTVTWTVTDGSGNSATCHQLVEVGDNVSPTYTRPGDITIYTDANCNYDASVSVTGDVTDEADNCSTGLEATHTDIIHAGPCQGAYIISRTWSLVDNSGNTAADQLQTITVLDNIAPTFSCPGNITICYSDAAHQLPPPVVTDNCGTASISNNKPALFPVGVTTVKWTATDNCGNTSTCFQTITRSDQMVVSISQSNLPVFCQGAKVNLTVDVNGTPAVGYQWSTGEVTQSIEVGVSGTYIVIVTNDLGCTGTASIAVTLDITGLMSSYLMITNDKAELKGTTVNSGGIGVLKVKDGKIQLGDHSNVTASGTFAKAAKIEVDNNSHLTTAYTMPATIALPPFELNTTNSNTNVNIPDNHIQAVTLSGAAYHDVEVGKSSTVIFTQSNICLHKLHLHPGASVKFTQCAKVHISDKLETDELCNVNPDSTGVIFYVTGDVHFRKGVHANGVFYCAKVDHGVVSLDHNIHADDSHDTRPGLLNGMFLAKEIHSDKNNFWKMSSLCNYCGSLNLKEVAIEVSEPAKVTEAVVKNYPNPFSEKTTVLFVLPENDHVQLEVYDLSGRLIQVLFSGDVDGDKEYTAEFDGTSLPTGIYIYKLTTREEVMTGKMMLGRE